MATVPGPPTSLAQVRAVFGAPAGTPLHAFVRGGAWVPNIAANNGVPTAPPIRLAQLAGATTYVPLAVSVGDVYGATSVGVSNDYIGNAFINVSGGTPPYTYLTAYVSGTVLNLTNATTQSPQFNEPGRPPNPGTTNAVYKATVTDNTGAQQAVNFGVHNTIS